MEKTILFFGQQAKVNCDENCNKAWGSNSRPRVYMEIPDEVFPPIGGSIYPDQEIDLNDYAYLADNELQDAPVDPGTYEGGCAKPTSKEEIGNKWCVRECERCNISNPGQSTLPLGIKTFNERRYNIPRSVPNGL